ncbi:MAG: hypothetical protein ACLVHV_09045 [Oscillospiraceae bacterium]
MTAKEYLSQARLLDARINAKIQQVSALNDLATHATATLTGMPRNPNRSESRMAEAVVKIIDLQNEINHDIDELVDLKREITRRVKSIPNAEYQLLSGEAVSVLHALGEDRRGHGLLYPAHLPSPRLGAAGISRPQET